MANQIISPYDAADKYLTSIGVDYDAVLNGNQGMTREQLKVLAAAPWLPSSLKTNIYKMVDRYNKQARAKAEKEDTSIKDAKETYDSTYHVKATMVGTVSSAMMETIAEDPENDDKLIRWLPSRAKEEDIRHALNYGKVMTLETARVKGLGTRPGCQCRFEVINNEEITLPMEG